MRYFHQLLILCVVLLGAATFAEAQQNYKIRQTTSMNGQKTETTIYVKGSRQRTESGDGVATVEQCDLKRDVQISDAKKLYFIEPFSNLFDTSEGGGTTGGGGNSSGGKTKKGGTITMLYNITDTGERKQMSGLTARHLKTTLTMQSSPNACTDTNMRTDTDGWYVDLPQFSCPIQPPKNPFAALSAASDEDCQDKFVSKQTGSGKLGFALTETRTMKMGDDEDAVNITQSVETLEFSTAPLAAKLFDIPAGYTLAKSSQDLYNAQGMSQMMKMGGAMNGGDADEDSTPAPKPNPQMTRANASSMPATAAKKAGMIRIGVIAPTNRAGENVSTTNLQTFLIQKLTGGSVEAVGVASEADARAANCDYVLTSDFSKLKQSTASKIGGMFGKVTGTDTSSARNYDAQVDFKLTNAAGQMILQNKAAQKSESNVDRAAENVLALEAQMVLSKANK